MEIKVGKIIKIKDEYADFMKFMSVVVEGKPMDAYGEIVAVDPTSEVIKQYPEINPNADGKDNVIYYDVSAKRHFIVDKDAVELVLH